jgi:isopenicillin N synthase-like dioxygenase
MHIFPMTPSSEVPVIDLSEMRSTESSRRSRLAAQIWDASKDIGFFSVINHGVPQALIDGAFAQIRALFDLRHEEKVKMSNMHSTSMRGYFGIGDETPEHLAAGDLKEGFDLASELSEDDLDVLNDSKLYGLNQWPMGLPEFRSTILQYHDQLHALSIELLSLYARAMGKPEWYFQSLFRKPLAQLRLLRYPPQNIFPSGLAVGCGEHTDYGAISLLSQDAPGLEVQSKSGEWVEVDVIPGAFVINIGDLMARWSNDLLKANLHRVINRRNSLRHTAAFFLDPDYDAVIRCVDSCIPAGERPAYDPIVFGQYNEAKLDATFEFRRRAEVRSKQSKEV